MDCEDKHFKQVREQLESISGKDGSTNTTGVWRLRKKIFPKPTEQLTAKKRQKR